MFHQKVQRVNSDVSLQQQNQRFSPGPRNDFKPLPLPLTPDGKVDLSRLPTSDWIKNDPMIRRWAREDAAAAAKSSDTSNTTDVAQPVSEDDRTLGPSLERGNIDSTSSSNPSPDNQIQKKWFLEPNLSRFPTSDWIKNDPMIRRWAREDAAAAAAAAAAASKSSDTQKTAQSSIQAKLTVSTPGDKYELEADAMAAKVMAMPHTAIEPQQEAPNPTTPSVQRALDEDKTVSTQLENRIQNATGGSPLASDIRSFMEPRFGVDFSEIRVHTDSNAAAMCKEVGAKAFAVGNRIYYGAEYSPGNNELTAHELTHTIQQGAAKRFNRQVKQLPEPQEELVAKEINIVAPYNNRQMRRFPTEKVAPQPQKVEPGFNRISRNIALEEIPSSSLPAKQFTSKIEPNFNKIQPVASDKLLPAHLLEAKPFVLQKKEGEPAQYVSKTAPQIQRNPLRDAAIQALKKLISPFGQAANQVVEILQNVGDIGSLILNPNKRQAFLSNLVKAITTGFQTFSSNFTRHLQNGLVAWLTGALGSTVTVPSKLDTQGIVSLVLQVLGVNYTRVRKALVQKLGAGKLAQLEKGFDLLQRISSSGFTAAVQQMMQKPQELQTTVIETIRNWVAQTVVKAAIGKLVATFTGFGAIANVAQAIYQAIAFFIEQASQIQALVNAVKTSLGNIAAGQIGAAAGYIESTLARSLSLAINFLARQVGLGNVGQKVREIIQRVRARVDAAMNKLVDYVIEKGNSWLKSAGGGSSKPGVGQRPASRNPAPVPRPASRNPAPVPRPASRNPTSVPSSRPATQKTAPVPSRPATQKPQSRPQSSNKPVTQKPVPKNPTGQTQPTPADIRKHEQMASEAVQRIQNTNGLLKNYNTTRIQKTAQAQQLKPGYDRGLKPPIKFNVYFEPNTANAELDGSLGFKVVIAPNTTKKSGSVPTKKRDDYLEPANQAFGIRNFTRLDFQKHFDLKQSTADVYLNQWVKLSKLAKYSSGTSKAAYYSFDPQKIQESSSIKETEKNDSAFTKKINDYLEQIRQVFGMRRFTRDELQKELKIGKTTATEYLKIWMSEGQLFKYASSGKRDKLTQYTFDSKKGGERDYSEYLEEARQVFGMEKFTRSALQKHFKFQEYQALNCLNEWINNDDLFRYSLGESDSLTEYTFDEAKGGDRDCLEAAQKEFGMRRFKRAEFQKKFNMLEDTALKRLNKWVDKDRVLFRYLSRQGDKFTQYTFDSNKGGTRETTGDNRVIYGYKNPGKHTKVGVQILSKGLRADSHQPIQATNAEYHKKMARYDSKRPDSKYENFGYEEACLGHGPQGASEHWNKTGHKQTKDQNMEWNKNPDNYWGPEHKVESQASSSKADEFEPPSEERGSHPSWWSKNP